LNVYYNCTCIVILLLPASLAATKAAIDADALTEKLQAQAAALRLRIEKIESTNSNMNSSDSDSDSPPQPPTNHHGSLLRDEKLDDDMSISNNNNSESNAEADSFMKDIDNHFNNNNNNTDAEAEVDSFMEAMDHHFNKQQSPRDYSSVSRQTNLNQGQGSQQALDLAQSHTVRADSASSTHTHGEEDVLEDRKGASAAAITSSSTNKDKGYDG